MQCPVSAERVKIFLWLAFRRRHWTGDRRVKTRLGGERSVTRHKRRSTTSSPMLPLLKGGMVQQQLPGLVDSYRRRNRSLLVATLESRLAWVITERRTASIRCFALASLFGNYGRNRMLSKEGVFGRRC